MFFPANSLSAPTRTGGSGISLARFALAALALLFLAEGTSAQQYQEDQPDERVYRDNRGMVGRLLRNPANYNVERDPFLEYFSKYYFPKMTLSSPEALGEIGRMRVDFFNRHVWQTTDPNIQKDLTDLAYKMMYQVVRKRNPSYHPTVIFNALLVLGQLDERVAVGGAGGGRPPKPHADANIFLTQVAGVRNAPASFIVAALVGLERHAKYKNELPQAAPAAMTKTMLDIIASDEPPRDAATSVHSWVKRLAANVLSNLGDVGSNNEVYTALVGLISDDKMVLEDRCEVVEMLAKFDYTNAKVDAASAARSIVSLLDDISQREVKKIADFEKTQLGGGFSGGNRRGAPQINLQDTKYERRRVLSQLQQLRPGLVKVASQVPADAKEQVDTVLRAVDTAIASLGDQGQIDLRVVDSVKDLEKVVREAAESLKANDATAAAPSEESARS